MLRKIPFETSSGILEKFTLSKEASEVILPNDAPEVTLDKLRDNGLFVDLVNFLAFGLPPREGICWSIVVYRTMRPKLGEEEKDTLALAESWVKTPQEVVRLQLMQLAEGLDSETALYWLCTAVAWNGSGSIGLVDGPVVLPPKGLHASALLGAVSLLMDGTEANYAKLQYVAHQTGLEVARGDWPITLVKD